VVVERGVVPDKADGATKESGCLLKGSCECSFVAAAKVLTTNPGHEVLHVEPELNFPMTCGDCLCGKPTEQEPRKRAIWKTAREDDVAWDNTPTVVYGLSVHNAAACGDHHADLAVASGPDRGIGNVPIREYSLEEGRWDVGDGLKQVRRV
jgi:hypothetical protein